MKQHISAFNGGEVTPLVEGRTDLQSLQKSCRKMRNMIPTSAGAAVRRPSLLHVATLTDETGVSALIPFKYGTETRYQIAISNTTIRVYGSDGVLKWEDVFGPQSNIHWPNVAAFDPYAITWAQVNDVLFVAHPSFPPLTIQRYSDTSWGQVAAVGATGFGKSFWPAFLDEAVTQFTDSDPVESWTIAKTYSATTSFIVGGIYNGVTGVDHGPCPATWRLYLGTTLFTGSITIAASDTYNGTFKTLYTISGISIANGAAMSLQKEWFHGHAYMKITVTRTTGTATLSLRHLGSTAAPSVWHMYNFSLAPNEYRIYSSPPMWAGVETNEHIQLSYQRLKQQVEITVAASATDEFKTSSELKVQGKWDVFTVGSWQGDLFVETKESTGSWRTVRHLTSNKDQNYSISGTSDGETMRLRCSKYDAAATSSAAVPRFVLTATDGVVSQFVAISDVGSSNVGAVGMNGFDWTLAAQATTAVSRGAFSAAQGYPAAVCIHDQRVYFAGTAGRPTTLWASGVNDLFNFRRTGYDDGGFMFEIAANEGNPLQWLVSASQGIIAGTSGDEWIFNGADTGITPTNITARRQSRVGSAPIQAIPAAGAMIFIQRGSMHVQEYQFAWESQQYQAVDLTELVKHLTTAGIVAIAFSQNPEPMLWAVTTDGALLTCTYNRAQEVIAWAKHTTAGTFESVCCTYGETANADDVWFIVLRDGTRRLEKLDGTFWASLHNGGALYHMDAAKVKTATAFTTVTGLDHLEGKTVKILANGAVRPDAVVSSGTVSVPSGTTTAVVGLAFDSELQPMPFDLPLATGTVQGRKVQTPAIAARLYRTLAMKYADGYAADYYDAKLDGETSGIVRLAGVGRLNDSCEIAFKSNGALPLNVVALIPSVQVYGE